MDQEPSERAEIQRLIRRSQISRSSLEVELMALRHRLDLPSRIRGSLREHPSGWLLGSLAAGLAASLMFGRRRPAAPKKRKGISGVLLGLTLTAARPLAKLWLSGQVSRWAATAASGNRSSRAVLQNTPSPSHVYSPGPGPR